MIDTLAHRTENGAFQGRPLQPNLHQPARVVEALDTHTFAVLPVAIALAGVPFLESKEEGHSVQLTLCR